ncbi:MAG: DNA segregation ATPase FtsK/SpoIIIE, S-DNA-T family [Microgenomates group bacterium Gr01-1014_7]|nr:MAG: DNA segregation ATPase FtsK/SpoIIIE, S-DNA-T family [Microgenomates group bacterium Gr01-1014_7]
MARRRSIYKLPRLKLRQRTITAVGSLIAFTLAVLSIVALATSSETLSFWREFLTNLLGWMKILAPIIFVLSGLSLTRSRWKFAQTNVLLGFILVVLSLGGLTAALRYEKAGSLGQILWRELSSFVTPLGAAALLLLLLLVGLVVLFNTSLGQIFKIFIWIFGFVRKVLKSIFNRQRTFEAKHIPIKVSGMDEKLPLKAVRPAVKEPIIADALVQNVAGKAIVWKYPPLSLLSDKVGSAAERGDVKRSAEVIEKTLDSFGIQADVAEVNGGPAVTQYALRISAGTKISKIANLQHDIALALATPTGTVRIEAPIPGKSLVGIEVPNHSLEIVGLKHVLASDEMQKHKSKLAVALGRDTSSKPMVVDLDKMPHVLIAGTTGSGKSILLNSFITSLLFRNSPDELKIIMIDPKRVELTNYNGIPHLLTPVITEPEKILSSLKWAMAEMERRYKLFQSVGVRNITGYNEMSGFQALPYIIIVVDELADLMMFAPVEIEDAITRIAQLARATGIHLVVATQRPSVDVITGLIKANIPCRIAFNVSSMIDSRVILDGPGAEKLLGRGDMLFLPPDASKPMRIQGVFVQDGEINNLIKFLKESGIAPQYTTEVTEMPLGRWGNKGGDGGDRDELFEEAVRTVCQYDRASASLLQRRLRVGYARAARILDELEEAGIVGLGEGSKPRDVLVRNAEEYFAAQSSGGAES